MRKALWALAVLAAVALGTSVITAIVEGSAQATQSRQIATLEHEQTVDQKEIAALTGELHAAKTDARRKAATTAQLSITAVRCAAPQPIARLGVALPSPDFLLCSRVPQMRPKADVRQASLLYSGLPWRHVP
jgi:hypothetical protein